MKRLARAFLIVAALVIGAALWWLIGFSGRGFAPTLPRPLALFIYAAPLAGCALPIAWRARRKRPVAATWLLALAPLLAVLNLIACLAVFELLPRDAAKQWALAGLFALAWSLPWLRRR